MLLSCNPPWLQFAYMYTSDAFWSWMLNSYLLYLLWGMWHDHKFSYTYSAQCWQNADNIHMLFTPFLLLYRALLLLLCPVYQEKKCVSSICVKIAMENMIILLENCEKPYPVVNCWKENTCLQIWCVITSYPLLSVMAFTIILNRMSLKYFNSKIPQYAIRVRHSLLMHYWLVKYSTCQMSECDTAKS